MAKDRLNDLSELLSAYLDGELDEPTRAQVVAYLDRDPDSVRLLNELRDTRSMLQDLPHQSAPAGFSESVVSAVERQALLGVEPETTARISMRRRWGPIRAAASIAVLVGAAGSWIYWQSDRPQSTDLALRSAVTPETVIERATDRSIGLDALAMMDDKAEKPIRRDESRTAFKKSARGKGASPVGPSADIRGMAQKAEMEAAGQQQQSIVQHDLTVQAGVDEDEEVVALSIELDAATVYSPASGAERIGLFDLTGQLRGSRWGRAVRANFMRRLQANEPAASLASHDFSNESNMLTLSFASDAQRAEFTRKFEVYLKDNEFLSAVDPLERNQVVEPLTQNVLLRGRQGLNYVEPSIEQILLNAAPKVLEGLIDRYAETTVGLEDTTNIELQMGEMKVEGLELTRSIVRAMAVPELQRRILGEEVRSSDKVDDAAADPDERLTAAQWREHYARLRSAGMTKEGQAAVAKQSDADKDGRFARTEDESGQIADAEQGKQDGRVASRVAPPTIKSAGDEASEHQKEARQEKQVATAEETDPGDAGVKSKKRRARSTKGMPADKIELFGGLQESPPVSESADRDSRGRGGGGGGRLERLKGSGPSRPIGRASNLTFVLKLQTVPLATPKPTPEPIPEMGPPAPTSESDESEEYSGCDR